MALGQKDKKEILLTAQSYAVQFFIILYWLANYLQQLYKTSKLVYH